MSRATMAFGVAAAALSDAAKGAANSLDRLVLAIHRPFDISGRGDGPMVCRHCGEAEGPCRDAIAASKRIVARR